MYEKLKFRYMKKLKFKDIAIYLPYEVKFIVKEDCLDGIQSSFANYLEYFFKPCEASSYSFKDDWFQLIAEDLEFPFYTAELMPVLRKLDEIESPIVHPDINNGEEFIPKQYMRDNFLTDSGILDKVTFHNYGITSLESEQWYEDLEEVIQFLAKLHFDINDLIGKGLAVNIKDYD